MICVICKTKVDEVCQDGVCRPCHKSISFKDCMNHTWDANLALKAGIPLRMVKELYPNAEIYEKWK